MTSESRPSACPSPQDLSAFRTGALDDPALEQLAAHLADCPSCSWRLAIDASGDPTLGRLRKALSDPPSPEELACGSVAVPDSVDDTTRAPGERSTRRQPIPTLLGPFEILEPLSSGGMGDVYKARHVHLKKIVALKTLTAGRARDPIAVARFLREMEASGAVPDHPNVVHSTHADEFKGVHYLVMEYIRGVDLARLIAVRGPLAVADACELVRQAALGVAHLHRHGRVHRDLKPGNLMLSDRGVVKVLDLGLALLPADDDRADRLTSHLTVMGTVDYMAPEQFFDSHRVTTAADLYSLGCTLFKLLTGRAPFEGESYDDLARKWRAHSLQAPAKVSHFRSDIPAGLDALIERLLSKDPQSRGPGAAALADELLQFSIGHRIIGLTTEGVAADTESSLGITKPIHEFTVVHRPIAPLSPRTTGARWLSWVAAAVIGMAMPVLVAVAIHWGFPPTSGALSSQGRQDEDLEPGIWHRAFAREPKRITFPSSLDPADFSWKPDRDQVAVTDCTSVVRLGTGSIPPDRSFLMEVSIRASHPEQDSVGIFFGYHSHPGSRLPDHQHIVLEKYDGDQPDKYRIQLARWRQTGDEKTLLGVVPLPALQNREYTLRLHYVRELGLVEVRFDGEHLPHLVAHELNLLLTNEDFAGPFGIYMSGGTATYRNFRYLLSSDSR